MLVPQRSNCLDITYSFFSAVRYLYRFTILTANSKLFSQTVHSQNKHTRGRSSNLSKSLAIEQIQVFTKDQQNLQNQTLDLPSILPDIEKVTKLSFESILFDSNNMSNSL